MINEVAEIRQTILTFYFFGRQQVAFKGKIYWQIQRYLDEIETNVIRRELPDFIFKQRFTTISDENCMMFCVIYLLKRQFAAAVFGTECLIGSKLTVTIIHFWYISKDNAISIMKNSNLIDKKGVLQFFLLYTKNEGTTYYQTNRDVILNRAKDYNENDKERLRQQERDKYRNLSEDEKKRKERIWKIKIS